MQRARDKRTYGSGRLDAAIAVQTAPPRKPICGINRAAVAAAVLAAVLAAAAYLRPR